MGKLRYIILLVFIVLFIIAGYFGRHVIRVYADPLPSCGSNKELFSKSPIELENLKTIIPLGNLGPPGHTFPTNHLYFYVKKVNPQDFESETIKAPVLAPGDMWITRIVTKEYLSENPVRTDYSLHFSPCREFEGYFYHVTSLVEKLRKDIPASGFGCNEYTTGERRYRMCQKDVKIKVNAGEVIGTAGGRKGENALDFGASDMRNKELEYANKERWYKQILHLVCALDYYKQDVRNVLMNKLGDEAVKRTIEPKCGEVEQDELGTAQGVWFVKGTKETYPEDPHIALAHDNIDAGKGVLSIGISLETKGIQHGTYYFKPLNSGLVNRDFKHVKEDGKIYCYETQNKFSNYPTDFAIILQLINSKTLRIGRYENKCGNGPWDFNDNYIEFER